MLCMFYIFVRLEHWSVMFISACQFRKLYLLSFIKTNCDYYFPFNIYFSECVCVISNVTIIAKDDSNETRSTLGMRCSLIVIWRILHSGLSVQFHWTYTNYFTRDILYHSISYFLDHCCVSVSGLSCW
jgi:hypothetical protein